MELERYSPVTDHKHDTYEFLSEGPKGTVKKVVQYRVLTPGVYNLAFGDWDEAAQEIRDDTRTNNADQDKVLATVAATVIDFMMYHPQVILFAQGSTPARTRLYQMGIRSNWHVISDLFDIQGFTSKLWDLCTEQKLPSLCSKSKRKNVNLKNRRSYMSTVAEKKQKHNEIPVVKKMRDYSKEPAFQKKQEKAKAFLQKHGLPEAFTKKK